MDKLNKKMKRASASSVQSHASDEAKLKYQTLLKEHLELQKEFVSRKRKLQAAKQKRETLFAEVRFLRRRRKYLLKSQATSMVRNSDIDCNAVEGERDHENVHAPETFDQVPVSNVHAKDEGGEGNEKALKKEVRFTKKLKNYVVRDKAVGKRKISWPDQVTLKV